MTTLPYLFTSDEQAALDRTPSISLQELRKIGLVRPEFWQQRFEPRIFAKVGKAWRDYIVEVDRVASAIIFMRCDRPQVKPTKVEYYAYEDDSVAYCSVSGVITDRLYFIADKIVCDRVAIDLLLPNSPRVRLAKTIARLEGTNGRRPSRGKTRERLLETLRSGVLGADPRAEKLLTEAARRTPKRKKRALRAETRGFDPLGTESGLARGGGGAQTPLEAAAREGFEAALVRRVVTADLGERARCKPLPEGQRRGVLEDQPRLDMRVLIREGHAVSGERRYGVIDWSGDTPLIDGLRFIVDLRAGVEPSVELEAMYQGEPTYQSLRLVKRGVGRRPRWCFLCPVTGVAGEVLALRYGRFASAPAQKLVNRSQMGKPRPPAARRKPPLGAEAEDHRT